MLGSPILCLKGMGILMFQLSGFYCIWLLRLRSLSQRPGGFRTSCKPKARALRLCPHSIYVGLEWGAFLGTLRLKRITYIYILCILYIYMYVCMYVYIYIYV